MNLLLHLEYSENQTRDTKLKSLKDTVLDNTLQKNHVLVSQKIHCQEERDLIQLQATV